IELGREIFGARKVASATFAGSIRLRPPWSGQSRRPVGQLCRDRSTAHRLRYAARSRSGAASAAPHNFANGISDGRLSLRQRDLGFESICSSGESAANSIFEIPKLLIATPCAEWHEVLCRSAP